MRLVDLKEVNERNSIAFLRMEFLDIRRYGPTFGGRVRYARDGVEQKSGFPMDLGKGIFIATLEDDELNGISRNELEESLREAAAETMEIIRRNNIARTLHRFLTFDDDFEYDEGGSEPPNLLRCRVLESPDPQDAQHLFDMTREFSNLTGVPYRVESYGAIYPNGDETDTAWREFALQHCTGTPTALPPKALAEASEKAVAALIRRRSETPPLLQTILQDYAHLAYDEHHSHPPNFLKCRVTEPERPRHESELFEIADALSAATGKAYRVASYGGRYYENKGFDEAWTHFALRVVNFGA